MTTLADLQQRRAAYLAAEQAALKAQSYQVGVGSSARRKDAADLAEVRRAISELDMQIACHPDNPSSPRRRIARFHPRG